MSEYFSILNRVEEEHADSDLNAGSKPLTRTHQNGPSRTARSRQSTTHRPVSRRTVSPAEQKPADDATGSWQEPAGPTTAPARGDHRDSFARAFDNLRAIASDSRLRSVVIAGAYTAEKVEPVIAGLAGEACRHQLQTLTAGFSDSDGKYTLHQQSLYGADRSASGSTDGGSRSPISFHLGAADLPDELTAWINNASNDHDLLLLHGPGLGHSVDAALIARATDGLIIVVEPGVTGQQELRSAVERARTVGCKILGLVTAGTHDELPTWMKRILG